MGRWAAVQAAAKVNLHLEILGRRPDGFHELRSLFQMVSLADDVRVRIAGPAGACVLEGAEGIRPEDNLMGKAASAFRAATGIRDGWVLSVRKRIPMGAGMGGGSSDAAAVLRCLQGLYGAPRDGRALEEAAASLGSDVPFFLGGPCALVEGRGETMRQVEPRGDFGLLCAVPPFPVATRDAFRWWDEHPGNGGGEGETPRWRILSAYRLEPADRWGFRNGFDGAVMRRLPALSQVKRALLDLGATAAALTGSGSTVLGLFPDAAAAARAGPLFPAVLGNAIAVEPLEERPSICYTDTLDS